MMKVLTLLAPIARYVGLLALAISCSTHAQRLPAADVDDGKTFRVIAFHDVRENVRASFERSPEATAVDERTIAEFFAWLQSSGHHPVSLEQVVRARDGGPPLPPRAVLLTFDDGYESTYTKVFPLLKQYRYPAVLALVTQWLESPPTSATPAVAPTAVAHDRRALPGPISAGASVSRAPAVATPAAGMLSAAVTREPDTFLTWQQVREMAGSGLVELASHSHAMHQGLLANPQGNVQPAAGALIYDPATQRYETVQAQRQRIETDLRKSRELIEKHTGVRVRTMVWPYGAFTQPALQAAARVGMPITFTLEEGPNTADVPLSRVRRGLATYDMPVPDYTLFRAPKGDGVIFPLNRAMHIDLDYVYDPDPVQQEANLSRLLERVLAIGPSSVFLQAFADPNGDGAADAMYFPNRHLPMRADLFNRVAWQLRTRTGVHVYAWMPVMAFQLPATHPLANRLVQHSGTATDQAVPQHPGQNGTRYHRLSPFDPAVREVIGDIYEDLGRHAVFAGILFHDDALLGDDEDNSPAALDTYARWGLPRSIDAIVADPALRAQWADRKTRYLTDFTLTLAERVRHWRPEVLTARNLYARPVMQPETGEWFSQDFAQSLKTYDYTAVMAMPFMEQADNPEQWLTDLVHQVAAQPDGLARTVFEIQARDWRTGKPIPDETLARQWSLLHRLGARHLAYYPDDFYNDQPGMATVRRALSVRANLQDDTDGLNTPPALSPPKTAPLIVPVDETPNDRTTSTRVPAK